MDPVPDLPVTEKAKLSVRGSISITAASWR